MRTALHALLLYGIATAAPLAAQKNPKPETPAVGLSTAGLAGQRVAVLPLTMVVVDARLPGVSDAKSRQRTARWADSLLAETLTERAPEVTWVLPPDLRQTAQRAAGILPTPDQMGQSIMRASKLKDVPDPLRSYLRQLLAMSGGARYALIPAALYLTTAPGDTLVALLSAVLADGRLGKVMWRTLAPGKGETADLAYRAALATILPPDLTTP